VTAKKRKCVGILVDAGLNIVKALLFFVIDRAAFNRCKRNWRKVEAAVIDVINAVFQRSPRADF